MSLKYLFRRLLSGPTIPILVRLPVLPQPELDSIMSLIQGEVSKRYPGLFEYVGIVRLEYLRWYFLQFNIPKNIFPVIQAIIHAIPQVQRVEIDQKRRLDVPKGEQRLFLKIGLLGYLCEAFKSILGIEQDSQSIWLWGR